MPPGPAELYELQERIGRGAFGTVYRAVPRARASGGARARGGGGGGAAAQQRPPVVAPHVAIKIVELEDMSDEIEDLQEEIAVLSSSAACPQLISYLGSYVVGACVWIVMEYLEGGRYESETAAPFPRRVRAKPETETAAAARFRARRFAPRSPRAARRRPA